jgi:hypothetical protein
MATATSDMNLEERTDLKTRPTAQTMISPDYLPVVLGRIARQYNGVGSQIAYQIINQTVRSNELKQYFMDMYNNITHA